jgi:hypothetical protein
MQNHQESIMKIRNLLLIVAVVSSGFASAQSDNSYSDSVIYQGGPPLTREQVLSDLQAAKAHGWTSFGDHDYPPQSTLSGSSKTRAEVEAELEQYRRGKIGNPVKANEADSY